MGECCQKPDEVVIMGGVYFSTKSHLHKEEIDEKLPVSTTTPPLWKRILFFPYYQWRRID
ncbi:MAG: hypothetical protein ABI207_05130 [Crocinitomicaceae bacterium]